MDKQKVFDFIKNNSLCVLSTASKDCKPQSAVMAYLFKDNFLFMFTENTTRKYKNILENNQVSVVVGGFKDDPSVQIDGTITELSVDEGVKIKAAALLIHPEWTGYFDSSNGQWFEIKPLWMRYLDYSTNPLTVFEV